MNSVRLEDVVAAPALRRRQSSITTAHQQWVPFYRGHLRENHRRPSTLGRIARAPSPFTVEGLLDDFQSLRGPVCLGQDALPGVGDRARAHV